MYCGHNGCFVADIGVVGNVNVIRASGKVSPANLQRGPAVGRATHQMVDFPSAGFWRPDLGVFVVPKAQVKELKDGK